MKRNIIVISLIIIEYFKSIMIFLEFLNLVKFKFKFKSTNFFTNKKILLFKYSFILKTKVFPNYFIYLLSNNNVVIINNNKFEVNLEKLLYINFIIDFF